MRYHQLNCQIFVENRKKFTGMMKPNSLAIFTSNDIYPTSADGHLPFKQHSDILYLSGADQEESILVLFPDAHKDSLREVLFLKETNDLIAVWEGAKYTKDKTFDISGIKTVFWLEREWARAEPAWAPGCLLTSKNSSFRLSPLELKH